MSDNSDVGKIGWLDLTVDDASGVRAFYESVVGWKVDAVPVGDYEDYCVAPPSTGEPVAGICHKRGANAEIPSQWLMYITIADLDESIANALRLGGKAITAKRDMGDYGTMCIIEDPAGAIVALMQPPAK